MNAPSLSRRVFKTSRLAEFCSQKELINQTGHAAEDWPLVVLKELVDNCLDATEEAGVAPVIDIAVTKDGIAVTDSGSGIAPESDGDILDYTSPVSSREAYVSPTRGAQGNALKTILAMPFALDGERGETIIESQRVLHRIGFSIDRIRQEPRISRGWEPAPIKTGTKVTVKWSDSASSIIDDAKGRFLQVAEDYTWVNPHLTLTIEWCRPGEAARRTIAATNPAWKKWRPSDPTSPHWYDEARLGRLMAAHIAHAEDHEQSCPTVRQFVSEFRGLSATAKGRQICEAIGASRMALAELYGDGAGARVAEVLAHMRRTITPAKNAGTSSSGVRSLRALGCLARTLSRATDGRGCLSSAPGRYR